MKTPRSGTTRSSRDGNATPRLPHERDESSDSGRATPDPLMRQAAADAESDKSPTDRGEVTDSLYARTLRGDRGDDGSAEPADATGQARPPPAKRPR